MTTLTVRDLQKNLRSALTRVARGETLEITRRRLPVARITPAPNADKPEPWPDLAARSAAMTGGKPLKGSPAADLVIKNRGL